MNSRRSLWRLFGAPLLLGVLSLTGLVWALLVDGPADFVAALATGSGLGVVAWALLKGRR